MTRSVHNLLGVALALVPMRPAQRPGRVSLSSQNRSATQQSALTDTLV